MNHEPSIGARLRAARHMAGYKSVPALALALGLRGVGATNLYQAERDERPVPYAALAEIAHLCGVPVEFFTADFSRLTEISDDPRAVIARETAAAAARFEELHGAPPVEIPPRKGEAR